jgi:dienelactone hydrolase
MKPVLGFIAAVIMCGSIADTVLQTTRPGSGDRSRAAARDPKPGAHALVPWHPGNAEGFQTGAVEERRVKSAHGFLPVTIYRPEGTGPFPFVVLMHGCGGLHREASWTAWVQPWADLLGQHGIGTAVVDSFGPRGVDQVCTGNVAAWAVRRADDAYSARRWPAEQPYVDPKRIAVMGMSNGGRTVLASLRTALAHPDPFVAGVALYPGCQNDVGSTFYAPLLVLIGSADMVTPARFCEQTKRGQPAFAPALELVVYPGGPHAFHMRLPDRTVLGMRLGHDAQAEADARRRVIDFLAAHGLIGVGSSR